MATLERPRQRQLEEPPSLIDAVNIRQRQEDVAALGFFPLSLPAVPSYDPRERITTSGNLPVPSALQESQEVLREHPFGDNQAAPARNGTGIEGEEEEDDMEEVLEELRDEVNVSSTAALYDDEDQLVESSTQDMDNLLLLSTAQSTCLAVLEPLLQSIQANKTQTELFGGSQVVDTLIEASRSASNSTVTSPLVPPTSLARMRDAPANHPLNRLIELLENIPKTTSIEVQKEDQNDDAALLVSLQSLMVAIDAARWTADLLDGQGDDSFELISTSIAHNSAPFLSHSDHTRSTNQQARLQSINPHHRVAPTSPVYPASLPSPSFRSEELRNPFADSIAVGQTTSLRSPSIRSEGDGNIRNDCHAYGRLMRVLQDVDTRCDMILKAIEDLPSVSHSTQYHEATLDASEEGKQQMKSAWKQLQKESKTTQRLLTKHTVLTTANGNAIRRGSSSPTYYTSHYSPTRARSRKNSNASFNSLTASLHSMEAGDPIGEATAAGVGMGPNRSLSRLSVHSNHSSTKHGHAPITSSLDMMRRGSTRSEHSASHSIQSLPPRYSEDSAHNWVIPTMAHTNQSINSSPMARSRTGSIGGLSGYSSRTLPAYEHGDVTYQQLQSSKKGLSTASLAALERSRSFSMSNGHTSEKTLQDLNMVENSIERLYSAVPQLDDQRAWSPDHYKRRNAEKQAEMLELFERLSKGGRMEDQRVTTPVSSRQLASSSTSKIRTEGRSTPETPTSLSSSNGRVIRRLGSISFGSLSLRRAASVLGSDGKGKGRAKEKVEEGSELQDKRASEEAIKGGKVSKLDTMGLSTVNAENNLGKKQDDKLFDVLTASMAGSRMANQDAVMRLSPIKDNAAKSTLVWSPSSPSMLGREAEMTQIKSRMIPSDDQTSNIRNGIATSTSTGESLAFPHQDDFKTDSDNRSNADHTSPDRIELLYIAETQPRLELMPVHVWIKGRLAPLATMQALSCAIDCKDNKRLSVRHLDERYEIMLPSKASADDQVDMKAEWNVDRWNLRLRLSQCVDSTQHGLHAQCSTPLSASYLQKTRPSALCCNGCQSHLAQTQNIDQYLPLPSQHWEELVDAWMCHADQELNKGMIETQKKLDEHRDLSKSQVRVSEEYVVIHSSLLIKKNIVIDDLKRIRCQECNATLGQVEGSGVAKLYKYAFYPQTDDDDYAKKDRSLLAQFISSKLIRLSQAHSTRHFVIQDDNSDIPTVYLKIWLFSENLEVSSNSKLNLSPSLMRGTSACKIMYQDIEPLHFSQDAQRQEQAWSQPDSIEILTYPKEICLELRDLLQQSSLCYPPSCRSFGQYWTVGFLEICR